MDTIHIEGLRVDALVGVHPHERDGRQPLLFDLALAFDNTVAAATDDVADALDYAAVCEAVRDFVAGRGDQLLETLLEGLAEALMAQFTHARQLRLRVHKPEAARALGCADVGVSIVRDRRQ
ncbi:MAG: dihydroneopterin aldolase [Gammaproteobacteria bacterium]|nr:dihydroneopterin aldolase [Gammaproteobacteria bacterium]